jgi:anti-sigma B factor antagonist
MIEAPTPVGLQINHVGTALRVSGEVDIATAPLLARALESEPGSVVCVDMQGVPFMDSTGAHVLIRAAETLRGTGCVILHGPQPPVARVFEMLGLTRMPNLHVLAGEGLS